MVNRYKYSRTFHLPWSLGRSSDDKTLSSVDHFMGKPVVVTEKMDGENTTMYPDYIHARSIDGRHHPSRDWVKQLQGEVGYLIPDGWRICGENLYARHSIPYENLPSYFMAFSVWDQYNICLDWNYTKYVCHSLNLHMTPVLYEGVFDEALLRKMASEMDLTKCEGYIVRLADQFHYDDFATSVAKFVREDHVQSEDHWMHQEIIPNRLK